MKESPSQCMTCRRWFVASGQIVPAPRVLGLVSHGLCPDCYIEQTAPLRPHTLAAWVANARTSAQDVVNAFAVISPGLTCPNKSFRASVTAGTDGFQNPHSPVTA